MKVSRLQATIGSFSLLPSPSSAFVLHMPGSPNLAPRSTACATSENDRASKTEIVPSLIVFNARGVSFKAINWC